MNNKGQDWPRCRYPGLKVQDFAAKIYNSERREAHQNKTKTLVTDIYKISKSDHYIFPVPSELYLA